MSHNDTENDNVVQMPVQNMKKVLYKEHMLQKRNAFIGSFIVFLAMFGFANHLVWNGGEAGVNGRGIASADGSIIQRTYNKEFEAEMLALLKESKDISMARKPNAMEQFQFGELKGVYNLKFKRGKIQAVELNESLGYSKAEYEKSPLDFLLTHSDKLPVKYDRVDKISDEIVDGLKKVSFHLTAQGKEVAKAHFQHNKDGKLISFQID